VRLDAVVVGGRLEVERRIVLVEERRVADCSPLLAVARGDHVEQRPRDALGEQDGEQADQDQDLAQAAQRARDQELRDGEQPLDQRPPPNDVAIAVELQLAG
jgi:hypothetical protein